MRVRFGRDPHWQHLDEPAARVLLQLPADADWRPVRAILFRLGRFHYHSSCDAQTAAAAADTAAGRRPPPVSLMERVVQQLFASRSVETAGLAVQPRAPHSSEAGVHRLVDAVLQRLRTEQLSNRDGGNGCDSGDDGGGQHSAATVVEPLPAVVEQFVLDGLRSVRSAQQN